MVQDFTVQVAKMAKKKVEIQYNPNWTIWYEYQHGKDIIVPGTPLKIKYERGIYKFEKHVVNSKTKTEWIDVIGPDGYRSFYPERLKGIIKPKRKRKKKDV